MELIKVEYRVKPVTRYVITRYYEGQNVGGLDTKGEYDNGEVAFEVAYALCKAEHERLGWPVADDRIQYPSKPACMLAPDGTESSKGSPKNIAA